MKQNAEKRIVGHRFTGGMNGSLFVAVASWSADPDSDPDLRIRRAALEHVRKSMPSDLIRGWVPVRVKKTRQIRN
jgi:hypothetical protein